MSRESARAFLERLRSDDALRAALAAARSAAERRALAAAAGFAFTGAEYAAAQAELPDDELDDVVAAGGDWYDTHPSSGG